MCLKRLCILCQGCLLNCKQSDQHANNGHHIACYTASVKLQQVADKKPCVVLQSMRNQQSVNLTAMIQQIPPDVHIYWYTAENGVSLC